MAKTSIISIIIFFSFNCLTSQDIGIGTTWVYNQGSFFPNSSIPDITELKIIADTIINGKTFYVLEGHCLCSEEDPLILRWENQKIYNYFNDTEHIFYDFNLQAGDSLKVKFPTYDTSYTTLVLIDSVSSLNNRILQHVTVPVYYG